MSILVTLIPDGNFIGLTTISRRYRCSPRFLMSIELAKSFLDGTNPVLYDSDLNNFLSVYYRTAVSLAMNVVKTVCPKSWKKKPRLFEKSISGF